MPAGVAYHSNWDVGEALSGKHERDSYEWDAVRGSERLGRATMGAILRFADHNHISEHEARETLLGRERRSGEARFVRGATDLTGHRPSEIVARPIGEIIQPIVARVMEGSRG